MDYKTRAVLYKDVETERSTKVLAYATSDRAGMETTIALDCVDLFVDLLDKIGPTKKISLILHANGGQSLAAWRIVNLIRTFCDELEVLIPMKALSAGTLISIGADRLVMTKQAALGPIAPSVVNNPLNPSVNVGGQMMRVPVGVENVLGYLHAAKSELNIKSEKHLASILQHMSSQVHPLVLGEVFRSRAQIRFLADKLLKSQVKDAKKIKSIISFLCANSGGHDYTINRREAKELGLNVETPNSKIYDLLRAIHLSYNEEMRTPGALLPASGTGHEHDRSVQTRPRTTGGREWRMLPVPLPRDVDEDDGSVTNGAASSNLRSKNF